MSDYQAFLDALLSSALNVPKGHGMLVFSQLSEDTAGAKWDEILEKTSEVPMLQECLDPGENPKEGAARILLEWMNFAALQHEDICPSSYKIQADQTGLSSGGIISDSDRQRYEAALRAIKDSGLCCLYFEPHLRVPASRKTAQSLPLIYFWLNDQSQLMQTINGAAIDLFLEKIIPRAHPHFIAVREWIVERLEALANVLAEHGLKRQATYYNLPRWDHARTRREYRHLAKELVKDLAANTNLRTA